MAFSKSIFITTGDTDGIGLEVACKALTAIGPRNHINFILYAHPEKISSWKSILNQSFRFSTARNLKESMSDLSEKPKPLNIICNSSPPVRWVEEAARHCLKFPDASALVTGPLSKTGIQEAGYPYIGHTELLKKMSRQKNLFQVYLGSKMNVLLITDHISLEKVPEQLMKKGLIRAAITEAMALQEKLKLKGPLAFLALDPHAGESGIIGTQDQLHVRVLNQIKTAKNRLIGPIPADTAFEESFRSTVGLYIALYHDQGLIPFKSLHGFGEGVHLTAGLPFVRTSVDHGTAKNLYGKNKAQPGSMIDAIKTAIKLVGKIQ